MPPEVLDQQGSLAERLAGQAVQQVVLAMTCPTPLVRDRGTETQDACVGTDATPPSSVEGVQQGQAEELVQLRALCERQQQQVQALRTSLSGCRAELARCRQEGVAHTVMYAHASPPRPNRARLERDRMQAEHQQEGGGDEDPFFLQQMMLTTTPTTTTTTKVSRAVEMGTRRRRCAALPASHRGHSPSPTSPSLRFPALSASPSVLPSPSPGPSPPPPPPPPPPPKRTAAANTVTVLPPVEGTRIRGSRHR